MKKKVRKVYMLDIPNPSKRYSFYINGMYLFDRDFDSLPFAIAHARRAIESGGVFDFVMTQGDKRIYEYRGDGSPVTFTTTVRGATLHSFYRR